MTPQDIQYESLILVSIGKLYSEQATYLTGELKHQVKYEFNLSVKSMEKFINEIEKNLSDEGKKTLTGLVDCMHDGLTDMRKQMQEHRNQQNQLNP